jgi:hypothetical protein
MPTWSEERRQKPPVSDGDHNDDETGAYHDWHEHERLREEVDHEGGEGNLQLQPVPEQHGKAEHLLLRLHEHERHQRRHDEEQEQRGVQDLELERHQPQQLQVTHQLAHTSYHRSSKHTYILRCGRGIEHSVAHIHGNPVVCSVDEPSCSKVLDQLVHQDGIIA